VGLDVPVFRDEQMRYILGLSIYASYFTNVLAQIPVPKEAQSVISDQNNAIIAGSGSLGLKVGEKGVLTNVVSRRETDRGRLVRGLNPAGEVKHLGKPRWAFRLLVAGKELVPPLELRPVHLRIRAGIRPIS
jgi:hypothetical protein